MIDASLTATLSLGFLLGLSHAIDADHVAAVATLVGTRGAALRRSVLTGLFWGAGHAVTLACAGGVILALRLSVPAPVAAAAEIVVAVMLAGLGALALRDASRERIHTHEHTHDGVRHVHLHVHAVPHEAAPAPPHGHAHPLRFALRPLLVGGAHGLAGSAPLALLALATVPTLAAGIAYLAVFGAGSIVGMAAMSLVLGAPLVLAGRLSKRLHLGLRCAAGAASLVMGVVLAWRAVRLVG